MELIVFVIVVLFGISLVDLYNERKYLEDHMKDPKRKHFLSLLLANSFLGTLFVAFLVIVLVSVDLVDRFL